MRQICEEKNISYESVLETVEAALAAAYANHPYILVAAAIERQKLRPGREKNPNSMMGVQAVFGMALAAMMARRYNKDRVLCPIPSDWKGSVPKPIHHKRILARLKVSEDALAHIPKGQQQHVIDAAGLALWAADQGLPVPKIVT